MSSPREFPSDAPSGESMIDVTAAHPDAQLDPVNADDAFRDALDIATAIDASPESERSRPDVRDRVDAECTRLALLWRSGNMSAAQAREAIMHAVMETDVIEKGATAGYAICQSRQSDLTRLSESSSDVLQATSERMICSILDRSVPTLQGKRDKPKPVDLDMIADGASICGFMRLMAKNYAQNKVLADGRKALRRGTETAGAGSSDYDDDGHVSLLASGEPAFAPHRDDVSHEDEVFFDGAENIVERLRRVAPRCTLTVAAMLIAARANAALHHLAPRAGLRLLRERERAGETSVDVSRAWWRVQHEILRRKGGPDTVAGEEPDPLWGLYSMHDLFAIADAGEASAALIERYGLEPRSGLLARDVASLRRSVAGLYRTRGCTPERDIPPNARECAEVYAALFVDVCDPNVRLLDDMVDAHLVDDEQVRAREKAWLAVVSRLASSVESPWFALRSLSIGQQRRVIEMDMMAMLNARQHETVSESRSVA